VTWQSEPEDISVIRSEEIYTSSVEMQDFPNNHMLIVVNR